MSPTDVTVVLVHGAWADGSSWAKIIAPLAADGYRVTAASLPLTSFEADVSALSRTLARVEGPVVLAGHAYGGAVISAARSDKVKALVYIAAGAPDQGETVLQAFYGANPPQLPMDEEGNIRLPDEAFAGAFAPNASASELAVLAAVQRPISPACITVPLARPLWKDVPAWFLVAEQDQMLPTEHQRFMAERVKARIHSHAVDHTPIITAPETVLGVIREAINNL
jgi:pimeloyl-ACP methyl ester carboxylesterase